MSQAEASKALDEIWDRADPQVAQLCDIVEKSMYNPRIPMLMRVAAVLRMAGAAADGLASLPAKDVARVHKIEYLPDLIITLRATADLFEHVNKSRTN